MQHSHIGRVYAALHNMSQPSTGIRKRLRRRSQGGSSLKILSPMACILNEPDVSFAHVGAHCWEADIATGAKRDFASLLDDLFVASGEADEAGAKPTIPFDYLSVVDELHSGRIKVSGEAAAAEYRESGADLAAEFSALLDQARVVLADEHPKPEEALPPIDPDAIASELGLGHIAKAADLARLRRDFAFANHPDRVAPHLRQRAMIRMQVANMLIDEAKKRALAATRRR